MLAKFFKGNSIVIIVLLPIIASALGLKVFSLTQVAEYPKDVMPFFQWVVNLFIGKPLLTTLVVMALIVIQSIIMIRINDIFSLIQKKSKLPGLLYLLFATGLYIINGFSALILVNILISWILYLLFKLYKSKDVTSHIFNISLILSLASLFYIHVVVFLPLIWVAVFVLSSGGIRQFFVSILGFILPYIFACVYHFYFDSLDGFIDIIKNNYLLQKNIALTQTGQIYMLTILSVFVIALIYYLPTFTRAKINIIKYNRIILYSLGLIIVYLAIHFVGVEMLYIAFLPMTYIISYMFVNVKKNWVIEIFLLLIIAATVFICIRG